MAREVKRRTHTAKRQPEQAKSLRLPFTKINYILFSISILVLIIGYIFLSIGPANSVWSLTIAPIVLLLGYVVLIPLSIIYKWGKKPEQNQTQAPHEAS
jgi:hypothetical protein